MALNLNNYKRISELTEKAELLDADVLPVDNSSDSASQRITFLNLVNQIKTKLKIGTLNTGTYIQGTSIGADLALLDTALNNLASDVDTDETNIQNLQTAITNILGLFGTAESSPSTNAYSAGEIIWYSSKFHQATTDIAVGDTLTEGTNIEEIKVSDISNYLLGLIQSNTGNITSLSGRMTTAESDIDTAESNIQTLQGNMQTAQGNITTMQDDIADLKDFTGYVTDDVVGVCIDYQNKTFTRLAGAEGKSAGTDFDQFLPFGGRRRCNVADDGTINAYHGDAGYTEDGSNGQVMVYQPKFYYKRVPLKLEKNTSTAGAKGFHIRKENIYVSAVPHAGFKIHPLFLADDQVTELPYVLLSAFEASIYDTSAGAYITDDAQVMNASEDKLSSIGGVKPASGRTQNFTRPTVEQMAQNRGSNWHGDFIQAESANIMLMFVELAGNLQNAIGQGVVSISDSPNTTNNSSLTGSTGSLGNRSGRASQTINERNGTTYTETADGKTAVTYRGMENPWGNIWKFVYGVNIWGDGTMGGGQPYVCINKQFAESKKTDNYHAVGFTVANANGYINAFGYGDPDFDWVFFPSEVGGNSSLPIGDYFYKTENLNEYRIALLGGLWYDGMDAGVCWHLVNGVGSRYRGIGGRLVYVPTAVA